MIQRIDVGATVCFLTLSAACSSSSTTVANSNVGGSTHGTGGASSSTAGSSAVVVGSSALGGASSSVGGSSATNTASGGIGAGGTVATGGAAPTGGTVSTAPSTGGSHTGGAPVSGGTTSLSSVTGGAASVGGAVPTGGVSPVGGTSASGGAKTGGASATGGTVASTGGLPATGGVTASGGLPATGGASTLNCAAMTNCNGACVDVKTSGTNCGACSHSCLGGRCTAGQCEPVLLGTGSASSTAAKVFYVDSSYVYYVSASMLAEREPKTDTSGTGTQLAGSAYYSNYTVVGNSMFYNCSGAICYCSGTVCSGTPIDIEGSPILNVGTGTQLVPVQNTNCTSASFCIEFLKADGSLSVEYVDSYIPASGSSSTFTSFIAAENYVYWIASDFSATSAFITASLFRAGSAGLARAQLAGNLTADTTILNVNGVSVLLADAAGNLLRVALPLGVGAQAPQSLGVKGVSAIEDASKIYWIDSQGTVNSCTASSCASSQAVIANGQTSAGRILQDSASLYWGRANSQVMRLAK